MQRILVRLDVSRDMATMLPGDIKRALDNLQRNPVRHSTARATHHHGR